MTRESKIVAVSATTHFLTHMNMLIFPAIVMPFSREMGLTPAEVFPLGFLMYFLYGAFALPAGYMADHWSNVGILRICLFGMGVSSLSAGFSTGVDDFTISLAAIGLFCGLYHPAGLGLIAHEIKEQGAAHGTNGIFGNFGLASAPFIAGLVLMMADWRFVFFVTGAFAFAGFLVTFVWTFKERERGLLQGREQKSDKENGLVPYFILLCVIMTVAGLTYRANMTAMPPYFEERASDILQIIGNMVGNGTSADVMSGSAALLVSTVFIFSMAGQYAGGKIADKLDLRVAYIICFACGVPFVTGMAFFSGWWLYFASAGYAFFSLGLQPVENSLVSKFTPKRWLSTAYGIKFTLTFGLGSVAVWQVAIVGETWGLSSLYPSLAVQTVLMVALAYLLFAVSKKRFPRIANRG